jgi:hypothetical protein
MDMGLIELLDRAYDKFKDFEPLINSLVDRAEGIQNDVQKFRTELCEKSDVDLFNIGKQSNNRLEKFAVVEILKERGYLRNSEGKWSKNTKA